MLITRIVYGAVWGGTDGGGTGKLRLVSQVGIAIEPRINCGRRRDGIAKRGYSGYGPINRVIRADTVAAAVHLAVKFVSRHQIEAACFELQVAAVRIIETAVIAVQVQ